MKKLTYEKCCDCYIISMLTLFLLGAAPGGYTSIVDAKLWIFVSLATFFLLCIFYCCIRERKNPLKNLQLPQLLIFLYLLMTLISALASPWRFEALIGGSRCEGFVVIALYCLTGIALSLFAKPRRFFLYVAAGSLTFYCIVCLLQFFDLNPFRLYPAQLRWSGRGVEYNGSFLGFTGNVDLSAAVLCLFFPLFPICAFRNRQPIFLLPGFLCLLVIFLSGVSGSLLGAVLGSVLSLPLVFPGTKRQLLLRYSLLLCFLFLIVLLVYFVSLPGALGEAHAILHGNAEDSFGSGRIYIWRNTLPLLRDRLMLGGGADCFSHRMTAVFRRISEDGTVIVRGIDCAHCEYLNILVNQGLPALLFLLSALFFSIKAALHTRDTTVIMLLSSLLCYGVQAFFGISMIGNTALFWLFWGLLLSAAAENADAVSDT